MKYSESFFVIRKFLAYPPPKLLATALIALEIAAKIASVNGPLLTFPNYVYPNPFCQLSV